MSSQHVDVTFTDSDVNFKSVYQAGQLVPFVVTVKFSQPISCTIYARVLGECSVSWMESNFLAKKVAYRASEVHLNHKIVMFSSEQPHPSGKTDYPVKFILPGGLPSSFAGEFGFIRYSVTAGVETKQSKLAERFQKAFTVVQEVDLNTIPKAMVSHFTVDERLPVKCCFCCCGCSGSVRLRLSVPQRAFTLGDLIEVSGEVKNDTMASLEGVRLQLVQRTKYMVSGRCKYISKVASFTELPSVHRGKSALMRHALPVIKTLPCNDDGCKLIRVRHYLHIFGSSGCSWVMNKQLCEIFIGTVPLMM